jgi:hypothetical protein
MSKRADLPLGVSAVMVLQAGIRFATRWPEAYGRAGDC